MAADARADEQVTRTEVVDALWDIFDGRQLTKAQLIDGAHGAAVRAEVVSLLARLPDRPYWQPQQLWAELPDVPVA